MSCRRLVGSAHLVPRLYVRPRFEERSDAVRVSALRCKVQRTERPLQENIPKVEKIERTQNVHHSHAKAEEE